MSSCNPNQLLPGDIIALSDDQKEALITQLLYQISASTDSPQQVIDSARCFSCLSPDQLEALKTELLCRISQ